jgi:two-component system, chemotaxis family, protein-glutamate methylesterase/glutaminase
MSKRNIIVIGGSAGSTQVLKTVLGALPDDLDACIFIVTHIPRQGSLHLAEILSRAFGATVTVAEDGAPITPGRIVVAAGDRHLILTRDTMHLGPGPRENMVRPSVDPLFRSAALAFGPQAIGLIVSGMMNDGAAGLAAIKACGGVTIVQDPDEADEPGMPLAALAATTVDHVLPAVAIGQILGSLVSDVQEPAGECPQHLALEVEIALGAPLGSDRLRTFADPQPFTCPQCSGVLSEVRGSQPLRFRCQIGHAITAEALYAEQKSEIEEALRVALRVIEERVELVRRMGRDARDAGRQSVAELYESRIDEYQGYAEILRKAVIGAMDRR